jgi:hypothetical protein
VVGVGGCCGQRRIGFESNQLAAGVAHRHERRGVFLVLFWEDVVGGKPVGESDVSRDREGYRDAPRPTGRLPARGLFAQEVLDSLDADDVRVTYPFEPQHHELDVVGFDRWLISDR